MKKSCCNIIILLIIILLLSDAELIMKLASSSIFRDLKSEIYILSEEKISMIMNILSSKYGESTVTLSTYFLGYFCIVTALSLNPVFFFFPV